MASTLRHVRRYAEAERHCHRVIALAPDAPRGYTGKAWLQVSWRGDVEGALEILDEAERFVDPERMMSTGRDLLQYAGRYRQALALLETYVEPSDVIRGQMHRYPQALRYGDLHYLLKQPDSARTYFEIALPAVEEFRREDPEWYGPDLGRAYAGLGRTEDMLRERERVLGLMPYSRYSLENRRLRYHVAANYVMVGEVDRALEQIEFVLSVPGTYSSPHRIRLWPYFWPLRDGRHAAGLRLLVLREDGRSTFGVQSNSLKTPEIDGTTSGISSASGQISVVE